MRGQALLHACIRLDAQARAHISTLHQSTVALQRDVVGCTYSGEGACRDGGQSVCMHGLQGTDSMRTHVAHGLWIMDTCQSLIGKYASYGPLVGLTWLPRQ
eukprot:5787012-Pyramimonas_sp.AAC.3